MEDQATAQLGLPPGFRFHPSDEEIIMQYLMPLNLLSNSGVINEVDLNNSELGDLPAPAVRGYKMREQEWYFARKDMDRKHQTGTRTNRATESGNWKATRNRKDKEFVRGRGKKTSKQ